MAVILSNTGIALLAYMDGIKEAKTLGGVVLASASAAASAVYKVAFKRVVGDVTICQIAISFSTIAFCGNFLLWPFILLLHFTGVGKSIMIIHLLCVIHSSKFLHFFPSTSGFCWSWKAKD